MSLEMHTDQFAFKFDDAREKQQVTHTIAEFHKSINCLVDAKFTVEQSMAITQVIHDMCQKIMMLRDK